MGIKIEVTSGRGEWPLTIVRTSRRAAWAKRVVYAALASVAAMYLPAMPDNGFAMSKADAAESGVDTVGRFVDGRVYAYHVATDAAFAAKDASMQACKKQVAA